MDWLCCKDWRACQLIANALLILTALIFTMILPMFVESNTLLNPSMIGLMVSPGMSLHMVFPEGTFASPNIINVTHFYVKNNNTDFCKNVFMASDTKFGKTFINNSPARKAVNVKLCHIVNTFLTPGLYLGNLNLEAALFKSTKVHHQLFKSKTEPTKNNFTYVSNLNSVIHTSCPSLHKYGHFIWDILCPLLLLPSDLILQSTIFLDKSFKSVEVCALQTLFGVKESQLEFVKYNTIDMRKWYFVQNLYVFDSQRPAESCQILSTWLIQLSKEKYNTEKTKPYRFLLHNRDKIYGTRVIKNFEDLVKLAKLKFPNITWDVESPKLTTFRDTISYYNTVKLYFTPTGSDIFHALFMQPSTVVIIAMTDAFNINDIVVCHSSGVFTIVFQWPKMKGHFDKLSKPIPPQLFEKHLLIGFQTLQNGKFPSGKSSAYSTSKCWK